MALFAVSLTFLMSVDAEGAPAPTRELAIHVVFAENEDEARTKAMKIGRARETSYLNAFGETVRDVFEGIVETQPLIDDHLFDGMEVASWLYEGDGLLIENGRTSRPAKPRG